MKINQTINATPNFQVLSEDQIERIYFAALDVLARTGCRIPSTQALQLFEQTDAVVSDTDLVRLPSAMVERSLRSHPRKFTLFGRTGQYPLRMQKDEVHFGTGIHLPSVAGCQTGDGRPWPEIFTQAVHLADFHDHIDFLTCHGGNAERSGNKGNESKKFLVLLRGCTKPMLLGAQDGQELREQWRMGGILRGGEKELRLSPLFMHQITPQSPLVFTPEGLEQLLFCAEKGIPCLCFSTPLAGVTAPLSISGVLVQTLAEGLMGSVISFLQKPGLPYVLGGNFSFGFRLNGTLSVGRPELSLTQAAFADIVKWLGLPVCSTGGCSEATQLDQQAAMEMATSLFYGFLSGTNLVQPVGFLDGGRSISLDAILLSDEMIGMIKQIGKGIDTEDEYLALDVISEIGPGGEFISSDHTFRHYLEWYQTKYIDRTTYTTWCGLGSKTMLDNIQKKRMRILAEYSPEPLDPGIEYEMMRSAHM